MGRKKKAEPDTPAAIPAATSIRQFCRDHGISPPTYYALKRDGLAPKEMRIRNAVRISAEDAAAWRKERANPSGSEAEAQARNDAARRERAKRAVNSTQHVSKFGGVGG